MKLSQNPDEWFDEEQDKVFFGRLAEGLKFQFLIASRLLREGFFVQTNLGIDQRPLSQRYGKMKRSTDIRVGVTPERLYVVESKAPRFAFGEHGRGHPFPTTFVGPVSHWKSKLDAGKVPIATVIVSQKSLHMFVVPTFTKNLWKTQRINDRRLGTIENNLAAPKSCWVSWDKFVGWLRDERRFLCEPI